MPPTSASIALLGLGAMGRALAGSLADAGYQVTAWNRTPGRAEHLVSQGVVEASSVKDVVLRADVIVVCLYDSESVYQTLRPIAGELQGRDVVNLTSTTPVEARELALWADKHGVGYLDGAIMATPDMIGSPGAAIWRSNRSMPVTALTTTTGSSRACDPQRQSSTAYASTSTSTSGSKR